MCFKVLWAAMCPLEKLRRMKDMKRLTTFFSLAFLAAAVICGSTFTAAAQNRLSMRETRDLIRSLSSKLDDFQYYVNYQLSSTSADDDAVADARDALQDLKTAISAFEDVFEQRRDNRDDVERILDAAASVRRSLKAADQNRKVESDWNAIAKLLDRLAGGYGVRSDINGRSSRPASTYPGDRGETNFPGSRTGTASGGLTGTYAIDRSRSDSIADVIAGAGRSDTDRRELEEKLDAPEQIAIDVRGNSVTLATGKASPVTLVADGRDRTETGPDGRSIRVKAILSGDRLTISSLGGENDYTVTFERADSGRGLKVTRRITTEYLRETLFADSFYSRTDTVARLGIENGGSYSGSDQDGYSSNDPYSDGGTTPPVYQRSGEYVVRDGTIITAILDHEVDTKVSQNNDRFRLIVQGPDEYRGAVIDGYLSGIERSGRVSGRSHVVFNFQKITLRDGRSYDFAGSLTGLRDASGKDVRIDTEGMAKGDSQTKETIKRGGIGAGIGALIGAIAGGAKGAAIGAAIGGGAGAGSVIVQGKDDLKLQKGSTMTITASSPVR